MVVISQESGKIKSDIPDVSSSIAPPLQIILDRNSLDPTNSGEQLEDVKKKVGEFTRMSQLQLRHSPSDSCFSNSKLPSSDLGSFGSTLSRLFGFCYTSTANSEEECEAAFIHAAGEYTIIMNSAQFVPLGFCVKQKIRYS